MTVVVDASAIVAALLDNGSAGQWAEALIAAETLAAPHHLPVEVANILRRASLGGDVSADGAALAYADFLDLRIELFPYEPFASRIWELRENVTTYDGWYVALAEDLDLPLATIDGRLARASGPRCRFLTPTDPS